MVDDVVADTAHDGASHLAETACADDDHRDVLFFGHLADDLARLTPAFRPHPSRYLEIGANHYNTAILSLNTVNVQMRSCTITAPNVAPSLKVSLTR